MSYSILEESINALEDSLIDWVNSLVSLSYCCCSVTSSLRGDCSWLPMLPKKSPSKTLSQALTLSGHQAWSRLRSRCLSRLRGILFPLRFLLLSRAILIRTWWSRSLPSLHTLLWRVTLSHSNWTGVSMQVWIACYFTNQWIILSLPLLLCHHLWLSS